MNIVLSGYGAMGKLLHQKAIDKGHRVVGILDEQHLKSLKLVEEAYDVVVDFSHPSCLEDLLENAVASKKALVLGTTNYSDVQKLKIQQASKIIPIVYTANFSLGITVFEEVLKLIAPILEADFDIEVLEKHHNKKIDAPSGTAKMLVEAINKDQRYQVVHGREGSSLRGKEIGVHALRGGTIVGEHSVIFAGDDEVLEIKHEAHSKSVFANGAISAAVYVRNKQPGIYSMHDVLFQKGK